MREGCRHRFPFFFIFSQNPFLHCPTPSQERARQSLLAPLVITIVEAAVGHLLQSIADWSREIERKREEGRREVVLVELTIVDRRCLDPTIGKLVRKK